jgi:hypothetical protein
LSVWKAPVSSEPVMCWSVSEPAWGVEFVAMVSDYPPDRGMMRRWSARSGVMRFRRLLRS